MADLDGFDDHPSISASLEDFEHNERSPTFGLPSQHSGFKSEESEPDMDSNSEGPWSPPAWKKQSPAVGWYRHQPYAQHSHARLTASMSPSRSRGTSPQYESAPEEEGETTLAANIPLPRGSMSPVKEQSPAPEEAPYLGNNYEDRAQPENPEAPGSPPSNCKFWDWVVSGEFILNVVRHTLCYASGGPTADRALRSSAILDTRIFWKCHQIKDIILFHTYCSISIYHLIPFLDTYTATAASPGSSQGCRPCSFLRAIDILFGERRKTNWRSPRDRSCSVGSRRERSVCQHDVRPYHCSGA